MTRTELVRRLEELDHKRSALGQLEAECKQLASEALAGMQALELRELALPSGKLAQAVTRSNTTVDPQRFIDRCRKAGVKARQIWEALSVGAGKARALLGAAVVAEIAQEQPGSIYVAIR